MHLKRTYHVKHKHETANATRETMTIIELHQHYGHIAPSIAHHLVENGLVGRLKFDDTKDGDTFYESCIMTHKLIVKV